MTCHSKSYKVSTYRSGDVNYNTIKGKNRNRKIVERDVKFIRKAFERGLYTKKQLAKKFHCSESTIYQILRRMTYRDVT